LNPAKGANPPARGGIQKGCRPAQPGSTATGSLVVQDWRGNICEISDDFDPPLRWRVPLPLGLQIKCDGNSAMSEPRIG